MGGGTESYLQYSRAALRSSCRVVGSFGLFVEKTGGGEAWAHRGINNGIYLVLLT